MVQIKAFGFLSKRMNHDRTYTDILSNPITTQHRIVKQIGAEPFSTECNIDCKTSKYDYRYRVRHVAPKTTCGFRMVNAASGQRVKASDLLRAGFADNERSGGSESLILKPSLF